MRALEVLKETLKNKYILRLYVTLSGHFDMSIKVSFNYLLCVYIFNRKLTAIRPFWITT